MAFDGTPSSPRRLIAPVAGLIDFWDLSYGIHTTGGAVDTWAGLLRGKALTDGGVAGNRPSINGDGTLAFTGTNLLAGISADLNAKSALSVAIAVRATAAGANHDVLGQTNGALMYLTGAAAACKANWWVFTGGGFPAVEQFGEAANADESALHVFIFQADYAAALLSIAKNPLRDNAAILGSVGDLGGATTPTTMPNNNFLLGATPVDGFGTTACDVAGLVVATALWGQSDINRVSAGMKARFGTP